MSNPTFVPQNDSNFTAIRYYTAQDPYYYITDNRPMQDIETNLKSIRSGGGDAGRRAVLISQLNASVGPLNRYLPITATRAFTGLQIVQASGTTARVMPGATFERLLIDSSFSTQTIIKQASTVVPVDFTINAPSVAGTSIVYTIEGVYTDITSATMPTSSIPYVDSTNPYLESTLLNGELKLTLNAGTASTTGTQVPPTTTSGKFPLYNITIAQGASTYTVSLHANAPTTEGLRRTVIPVPLTSGGATQAVTNNIFSTTYVTGSVTGAILPLNLAESALSPYAPIKVKITFAPTVTGNAAAFRLRYKGLATGDLTTSSFTTGTIDPVTVTSVANGVQSYTTSLATIPTTEFAGFVSGNWVVNKEYLNIILERVGGNAADTNTGSINVLSVSLTQ